MVYCKRCGAQVVNDTAFCGSCGAPANTASVSAEAAPASAGPISTGAPESGSAAASAATSGTAPSPAAGETFRSAAAQSAPMASNVAGLVAYVLGFVTGIFMLVSEPYKSDKFVRFHALQSIFLSGVYVVAMIAWSIFAGILFGASFGALWQFVYLGWWLVRLAFFALWLFLMYKAYNNERFELPIIGPMAAKQAG